MNERSHVITGVELNFDLTRRRSLEDSLLDLSIHQHPLIDPIRDDRIQNSNANTCVYAKFRRLYRPTFWCSNTVSRIEESSLLIEVSTPKFKTIATTNRNLFYMPKRILLLTLIITRQGIVTDRELFVPRTKKALAKSRSFWVAGPSLGIAFHLQLVLLSIFHLSWIFLKRLCKPTVHYYALPTLSFTSKRHRPLGVKHLPK